MSKLQNSAQPIFAPAEQGPQAQLGSTSVSTLVLIVFVTLVAVGTWAAYAYGDGAININGRTISELDPWEVVGGVALGIVFGVLGLMMGAVGLAIGLVAAVVSIVLALAGVAVGLFFTASTLLGPFLLIAAIVLLLRRSKGENDEFSQAEDGSRAAEANAAFWT